MNMRRLASRSGRDTCAPGVVGLAATVRRVASACRQASPRSPAAGDPPISGASVCRTFVTVALRPCAPAATGQPQAYSYRTLGNRRVYVLRPEELHAFAAQRRPENREDDVHGDE